MSITHTGWHSVSDETYFATPAVSNSLLKAVHCGGTSMGRAREDSEWKPSAAMIKGTALHYACFDPEAFLSVQQRVKFTGAGSQAKQREWDEEHADAIVLSNADYDTVCRMADMARTVAGPFTGGRCELMGLFSRDDQTDVRKIKVDYLTDDVIWDVKSAAHVDLPKFGWQARDLHYDMQAAWYSDTAWRIDGVDRTFRWLVVKGSDPIDVRIYEASPDLIMEGRAKVAAALSDWQAATKAQTYAPRVQILEPFYIEVE